MYVRTAFGERKSVLIRDVFLCPLREVQLYFLCLLSSADLVPEQEGQEKEEEETPF